MFEHRVREHPAIQSGTGSMIRGDGRGGRSALCGGIHSMKTLTRLQSLAIRVCGWKVFAQSCRGRCWVMSRHSSHVIQSVRLMYTHSHTHIYTWIYPLQEILCSDWSLNIPIQWWFPHLSLGWVSPHLPSFHQPASQLIRQVHRVWTPPVAPAAPGRLWTRRQVGHGWINVLMSEGVSRDPGACSLPAALCQFHSSPSAGSPSWASQLKK